MTFGFGQRFHSEHKSNLYLPFSSIYLLALASHSTVFKCGVLSDSSWTQGVFYRWSKINKGQQLKYSFSLSLQYLVNVLKNIFQHATCVLSYTNSIYSFKIKMLQIE